MELCEELLDAIGSAVLLIEAEASSAEPRLRYANRAARELFPLTPSAPLPFDAETQTAWSDALAAGGSDGTGLRKLSQGRFRERLIALDRRRLLIVLDAANEEAPSSSKLGGQQFLDAILEHLPAMVFVKDAKELRFERFNRAGEALIGISRKELLGKSDYDFFPAEQADFFVRKDRDVLARRVLLDIPEEPIETPRGIRWLHTRKIPVLGPDGRPHYLLGVSIDITDEKLARDSLRDSHDALERDVAEKEEQLRQAQKMEAIGRLAGGVAHDFNNLLSVILSYSEMAQRATERGQLVPEEVGQIRFAAERAGELTRQLLAFSRRQVLEPRVIDLNQVIHRLDNMLRRIIGEHIELRTLCARDLGRVKVDPNQIERVIMNLVVNACDAMPEGGRLTIETSSVLLDEEYARERLDVVPGKHAVLSVSDTGTGMDRETQARIFEPFFTTKELGKGTGLGLSTVFGIVKQSGGHLWVYSEPGRGAMFKVYLPVTDQPLMGEESRPPPTSFVGSETILLVEDDDQVRKVVSGVLSRNGYRVLQAPNGSEALAIAEKHSDPIHLLLTDLVLPKMSGVELAGRIQSQRAGLRVLCMSGYTDESAHGSGLLEAGVAFLQKPLTPDSLLRKVREVLS